MASLIHAEGVAVSSRGVERGFASDTPGIDLEDAPQSEGLLVCG
ncbi:MAG: hypothetical protein U0640_13985 [Phycisphaerales bacterium]